MDNFHRFMAKNSRQKAAESGFSFDKQLNKECSHNEDERYLMEDQSEERGEDNLDGQKGDQQQIEQNRSQQSVDPLDAFMTGLEQQKGNNEKANKPNPTNNSKNHHDQSKNHQKSLKTPQLYFNPNHNSQSNTPQQQHNINFQQQQQTPQQYQPLNEKGHLLQDQEQYDLVPQKKNDKKIIQSLKPFDFSKVELEDFQKDFYQEHEDIRRLSEQEVNKIRKQMEIKVSGDDVPRPIVSFGHLSLDGKIRQIILKEQFQKPTPIQSQALPVALSGRDMIGVAKTGSGKTLAYVWPMITHVLHQQRTLKNQGPIGLVLAPTRQLCQQIYLQTRKYSKNIKIACLLGGQNKHEQWKVLKAGVDIVIASPGRLIEMIRKKATNMQRVTFLVLDEADKMLSLGFEQQIRSIVSQTRPDRQTLLFTATMKKQMQFLAFDVMQAPVRVIVGGENAANEDVKQEVVVVDEKEGKLQWMQNNLGELIAEGKVLVFCNQRQSCQQLKQFIQQNLLLATLTIHGDKSQFQRTTIMNQFKTSSNILIATDIASRGLDIKQIRTVVNFQCPKTIQAYIHRIGRTGRAGSTGTAVTLLDKSQAGIKFAIELVKIFENSGNPVSKQLQDLACLDDFYRRKRISSKMGVSFAKGKDASKFLNQILKRQQMGRNRIGLGMSIQGNCYNNSKDKFGGQQRGSFIGQNDQHCIEPQQKGQKTIAQILNQKNIMAQQLSISQLSKIIRQQMKRQQLHSLTSSKLNTHFTKSSNNQIKHSCIQDDEQQALDNGNSQNNSNYRKQQQQVTVSFYNKKQKK